MTPIKPRKRQKFVYCIFACKISMSSLLNWHSVMLTANFTCSVLLVLASNIRALLLSSIIQKRRLTLCGHLVTMDKSTDARRILTAVRQSEWRRPVGRPYTFWMATLKNDLARHNLTLEDAIELALNKPLWRLLAASGATHWWCMPNNEWRTNVCDYLLPMCDCFYLSMIVHHLFSVTCRSVLAWLLAVSNVVGMRRMLPFLLATE